MIISGLVIGAVGPASLQHSLAHDGPGCPFRNLTGINCPFCGMTRATLALGEGDWSAAFGFHPLAPIVVLAMLWLMAIIVVGRSDALVKGRRPQLLLGSVLGLWVIRLLF